MKLSETLKKITTLSLLTALTMQTTVLPVYASTADTSSDTEITVDVTDELSTEDATESVEETGDPNYVDVSDIPELAIDTSGLDIVSRSACLMDVESGAFLYEKDADSQHSPASITKILTGLVVLENVSLDDEVDYTEDVFSTLPSDSSVAGINQGAVLTVRDSMYALLLASANEAAVALAIRVGGSVEGFAELMNAKAAELGCTNSHFVNPHGYTADGHYVCARDMAKIMNAAIQNPDLLEIMSSQSYTIENSTLTDKSLTVYTHVGNILSSNANYNEYTVCGKTGYTSAAGNTLVTMSEKDGRQLICVILQDEGSDQACADTNTLTNWGFSSTEKYNLSDSFTLDYLMKNGGRFDEEELPYVEALTRTTQEPTQYIICNGNTDAIEASVSWKDKEADFGTFCDVTLSCGGKTLITYSETYNTADSAAESYQSYLTSKAEAAAKENAEAPILQFINTVRSTPTMTIIFLVMLAIVLIIGLLLGTLVGVVIRG